MEFSEKLKTLRTQKGISQQALAEMIYVSRSAVAKWENGLGLPCDESLQLLAKFFEQDPKTLIDENEQNTVRKNQTIFRYKTVVIVLAALLACFFIGYAIGIAYICSLKAEQENEHIIYQTVPAIYVNDTTTPHSIRLKSYVVEDGEKIYRSGANYVPYGEEASNLPELPYLNEYTIRPDFPSRHLCVTDVRYSFLNDDYSPYDTNPETVEWIETAYYQADRYDPQTGKVEISFMDTPCNVIILQVTCEFQDLVVVYSYKIHKNA